jgi:hypothetical protein
VSRAPSSTDVLAMLSREHRELERRLDEAAACGARRALADKLALHAGTESAVLQLALDGSRLQCLARTRELAQALQADLDAEADASQWASWRAELIEQQRREEDEVFEHARRAVSAERLESLGRLLAVLRVQWHAAGATRLWL